MVKKPAPRSADNPDALDDLATAFEQAIAAYRELRPNEYQTIAVRPFADGAKLVAAALRTGE